jgi:DNA-binding CsgD family transcriptional regulator
LEVAEDRARSGAAVHPDDLSRLLSGVARVVETGESRLVQLRLWQSPEGWIIRRVTLRPAPRDGTLFGFTPERAPQRERAGAGIVRSTSALHGDDGRRPADDTAAGLSARQQEVVSRIVAGRRVDVIARELGISPSTVRNHLSVAFKRFGVRSQSELIEIMTSAPAPSLPDPQRFV